VPSEEHIGCASDRDQDHPGNANGLVVDPALKADQRAKDSCRH
jgi:hypothetical protein